jgi:hypothetical protein
MITLHIEAFIVVMLVTFAAGAIVGRKYKR